VAGKSGSIVKLLNRIICGVTDGSIYRRIGWMAASFFLLFVSVVLLSYAVLPQGCLRGKHPIISQLRFSRTAWVSTLQIFGYNLIPTTLIILANLIAQQSRLVKERYVPVGYTAFWGLTILFAVITGSWSFDVATAAPPLLSRLTRLLDVVHHSGLVEFSAYLLAAVVSFRFTLWYSDGRRITASRDWHDIKLTGPEKAFLTLAFLLLLCAAYIESLALGRVAGELNWSTDCPWL